MVSKKLWQIDMSCNLLRTVLISDGQPTVEMLQFRYYRLVKFSTQRSLDCLAGSKALRIDVQFYLSLEVVIKTPTVTSNHFMLATCITLTRAHRF